MFRIIATGFIIIHMFVFSQAQTLLSNVIYKNLNYVKSDCSGKIKECIRLNFDYPEYKSDSNSLSDSLKQHINKCLFVSMYEGIYFPSLTAFKDSLIKEIESFNVHYPDNALSVRIERSVRIEMDKFSFITLKSENSLLYGDNLPELKTRYFSLNQNGKVIALSDIVQNKSRSKIVKTAETAFRKSKNIRKGDNYTKAGFWFVDNKFFLPDDMSVTENGIRFVYKKTELSHENGEIVSFVLPFRDITKYLTPEFRQQINRIN